MSDKLTTEQLQYIQTIDRTDDIASRHVRMMATEILNFRLGSVAKQIDLLPHVAIIEQERQVDKDISAFPLTWFKGWQFKNSENEWETYRKPEIYWGGGNQVRRHPHADIIMQCEDDKRLYPKFWRKLIQCKTRLCKWHDQSNYEFKFENIPSFEYRQHPHRASIIAWHGCSDEDKKCWQAGNGKEWIYCVPTWLETLEYRLRPRTCKVTINGKVLEYPEPVREPLEKGKEYWLVNLCCLEVCKMEFGEFCSDEEQSYLASGSIHLTEQAAQQHLAALQAVNAQVAL